MGQLRFVVLGGDPNGEEAALKTVAAESVESSTLSASALIPGSVANSSLYTLQPITEWLVIYDDGEIAVWYVNKSKSEWFSTLL